MILSGDAISEPRILSSQRTPDVTSGGMYRSLRRTQHRQGTYMLAALQVWVGGRIEVVEYEYGGRVEMTHQEPSPQVAVLQAKAVPLLSSSDRILSSRVTRKAFH